MQPEIYIEEDIITLRAMYSDVIDGHPKHSKISDFLEEMAEKLWFHYFGGNQKSCIQLGLHLPDFIEVSPLKIMAAGLNKKQTDLAILLEHGFGSWGEVKYAEKFNAEFEQAIDTMLRGEIDKLKQLIQKEPKILKLTSPFGHKSSLIHYLAANGIETWRQIVPKNAPDLLKLLLDLGANPDAENFIFGGTDMMTLIETSEHAMMAGVGDEMILVLQQ